MVEEGIQQQQLDNIYMNIPDCYDTGTSLKSEHNHMTIQYSSQLERVNHYQNLLNTSIKEFIIIRTYQNVKNLCQTLAGSH